MNQDKSKTAICFGLICCLGFCVPVHAQIYSHNIVGYLNLVLFPGDNLIANQFGNSDNSLNAIFQQNIPEGATFAKWDSTSLQYLPFSTYDTDSGWSINYDLSYGEGGLLHLQVKFVHPRVKLAHISFGMPAVLVMLADLRMGIAHALFGEQVILQVILHQ